MARKPNWVIPMEEDRTAADAVAAQEIIAKAPKKRAGDIPIPLSPVTQVAKVLDKGRAKMTSPMQVVYDPGQIPYQFPVKSDAEAIALLRKTTEMHSGFLWAQVMIKVADYLEGKKK